MKGNKNEMYNVKTIDNDEEFLRKKSVPVSVDDDNYTNEIDILRKFCKNREGFAISAIQLGIKKRIIYFNKDDKQNVNKIIINPKIINQKGLSEYWEACTSVPNKIGLVERPYITEIEYYDENFIKHTETFSGLNATIIQHELDHLDGILFTDKAKEVVAINREKREHFRKSHPYRIISKK